MTKHYDIIIIGSGISAISAIKAIREIDQVKSVLLISNEDRLPYKRTKINKMMDIGFQKEDFKLFPYNYYKENNITLIYDEVISVHTDINTIYSKTDNFSYFQLLIATGKKPRHLNFSNIPKDRIYNIYTARDAETLIDQSKLHSSYLVIGGGVEGLEMTDQLLKMGKMVHLVHNSDFLMDKQITKNISDIIKDTCTKHGVNVLTDQHVENHLSYQNNKIIYTINNEQLYFDAIIECIGSEPNCSFLENSRININHGIIVDKQLKTSVANVYAAGDVAVLPDHKNSYLWHAAEAQGYVAGKNILGENIEYQYKPFRLKCDILGTYIFSHNKPLKFKEHKIVVEKNNNLYREIFIKDDKIIGIVMLNDKERSKMYEKCVWEQWTLELLNKHLAF